ncbi:MAG TPA: glutaminyl-peptide cyclotransferase [Bacteroidales bacterium]|nr:glutaminyl-peptide cyclotransferase [Bacteroidales bacterium]
MKAETKRYFAFSALALILLWLISCSGKPGAVKPDPETARTEKEEPALNEKMLSLVVPAENDGLHLGSGFKVSLAAIKAGVLPDSSGIYYDGIHAGTLKGNQLEFTISHSLITRTGRKALKISVFKSGRQVQTLTRTLVVYSDVPPGRNGYRVIKSYPHDRDAFTQGLVYENGFLYEGTGQSTRSYLRKVVPETGQVVNQLDLDPQFFGEGIAIYGDRIYQLTWQSQVGFVYEKSNFRQVNKIYYQTEGWGITTIGNRLVMSDGTNILYYMDPESFSVVSTLEVYDNKAKVEKLNELEYINGEIWANIWQTDLIARIDPSSGKVIAYIDLAGILKDPHTDTKEDVLNGIAWDKPGNRIFITGKNWPLIFEIKLTE